MFNKNPRNWENERYRVIRHVISGMPGKYSEDDYWVIYDKTTDMPVLVDGEHSWKDKSESRAISYAEELTEDEEFEKVMLK